jgi:MFS family permease
MFSALTSRGDDFLMNGGWRIPFLLSFVLILVGFWVRNRVEESPVFEAKVEGAVQALPLKTAIVKNWKPILLGIGLLPLSTGGYQLTTTFATAYGTDPSVGLDETLVLNALALAALVELVATLGVAWLGDRWGRKRVMFIGLLGSMILVIPQFLVMSTGPEWLLFVAFCAMRLMMTATYAPMATIMAQLFPPQARYTSISLSNGIAAAFWGGLSPLAATLLYAATGSIWPVLAVFLGMGTLSIFCLYFAPQHRDEEPYSETADAAPATTNETIEA